MEQTILIVEDSLINQRILTELLTREGYRVLVVASGEMAIDHAKAELPDLIVMDILLPGMDGYRACKQLKNSGRTRHIPVIFMSSLGSSHDKVEGFEAGGIDYITKPFQQDEVLVRISTHLRIHRLRQQLEEKNRQLDAEKQKSERLLCHVLPESIAEKLLATGRCIPQLFTETTVCFTDIIDFTSTSSNLAPEVVIDELNEIFTAFDRICRENKCERMKTIGDAYLFACGVPEIDNRHALNVARAALQMVAFMEERNTNAVYTWQIRVGLCSGPLVGGVVGTEKYLYDIFGDTVNIAARVEGMSLPMAVTVASTTYDLLKDIFPFSAGREVEMKGKGDQVIYTLLGDS